MSLAEELGAELAQLRDAFGRTVLERSFEGLDELGPVAEFLGGDASRIPGDPVVGRPGRPVPRLRSRTPVIVRSGRPFLFESDDHEANADRLMAVIADLVREPAGVRD